MTGYIFINANKFECVRLCVCMYVVRAGTQIQNKYAALGFHN